MEEQEQAITKATQQNEEKIKQEVNKSVLNKSLDALKNTAGALWRHTPDTDTMVAGAELTGEVAVAAAKLGIATLKGTAWTIGALISIIDDVHSLIRGDGGYEEEGGDGGNSSYGGGRRSGGGISYGGGEISSGGASSSSGGGASSSSGSGRSRISGAKKLKADVEVDKAFIEDFAKKKPTTLTSMIMKEPLMIEIVHNFDKEERHNVEQRLETFKPRQLANLLGHLRQGYTYGFEAM